MDTTPLTNLQDFRCFNTAQAMVVVNNTQPLTNLEAQTNTITSAQVDAILTALDGNGLVAGVVNLSGQTPPAPPSAVGMARALSLIAKTWTVTLDPSIFIFDDGSGGFWQLIVDPSGNVGTQATVGPATSDVILADGVGGFWKIVVDIAGNRGTTPDAGPATLVPALDDGTGVFWKLIVDATGNLGAQQIVPIAWAPVAETVTWIDTNGTFVGDLSTFRSTADFSTVTSLVFGATGNLTSLTGIQELPALAILDCNTNALTSLDCTNCLALTTLTCSANASLATLTLTGCSALTTLDCADCSITGLDVHNSLSLTSINSNNNPLVTFDAHGCGLLNTITGVGATLGLISMDVSGCVSLTSVSINPNTVTTLNITGCSGLLTLDASANPSLSSITGLLTCSALQSVSANSSAFVSFSAAGLSNLTFLDVFNNPLTSLNVTGCTLLNDIECDACSLTSLDISTCSSLLTLTAYTNNFTINAVNTILVNLASTGLQGGTVALNNQTPAAPPSAGPPDGIAAVATLTGYGIPWTVVTD